MDKTSELECFMHYMWNKWDKKECADLFGERCCEHFWRVWLNECARFGAIGASATFFACIGTSERRALAARAVAFYNL